MHRLDTRQYLRFSMHSLTTSTSNIGEIAQTSSEMLGKTEIIIIFLIIEFFIKLVICITCKAKYDNDTKAGPNVYLELCQTSKLKIFAKIVNFFLKSYFLDLLLSS